MRRARGATVAVRSRAASEKRSLTEESMLAGMATAVGISSIGVVYLYVRDMARSVAFYPG
jgi:hypothetical protein